MTWVKDTASEGNPKSISDKQGTAQGLEFVAIVEVQGTKDTRACDLVAGLEERVRSGGTFSACKYLHLATRVELRPAAEDSIPPSPPAASDGQAQRMARALPPPDSLAGSTPPGQSAPAQPAGATVNQTTRPAALLPASSGSSFNRDMHQVLGFLNPVGHFGNQTSGL